MGAYEKKIDIRWSDLDPNFHLRHSVYYDYGAYSRISFLNEHGITPALMLQHNIGPILFREECAFKREITFGDELMINLRLGKSTSNISRWTMIHELWKKGDTLAAIITVDGAWIDTSLRKLAKPPEIFKTAFEQLPRTENFEYI
ncbi:MAG: thioesterase family protein [Ferruginibacter sp.]|nr:thioesterase family protein [Ferruginibacter sp.]